MYIKLIAAALLIAALGAAGWRIHHNIYQSGYAAAQKADNATLDAAADATASAQRTLADVQASQKACEDGRIADAATAKDAAKAADAARASIADRFAKADKKLRDKMAGECREWASQPACGSVP